MKLQISSALKAAQDQKGQLDYSLTFEQSKTGAKKTGSKKQATVRKTITNGAGKYFHEDGVFEAGALHMDVLSVVDMNGRNLLHED